LIDRFASRDSASFSEGQDQQHHEAHTAPPATATKAANIASSRQ
jgi:hypothetical protein